jgi:hypothetical protein
MPDSQGADQGESVDRVRDIFFGPKMRTMSSVRITRFENEHAEILARYDGNRSRFEASKPVLPELFTVFGPNEPVRKDGLERVQKRLRILLAGLLLVCLLMIGIGGLTAQPSMVDLPR